MIRAGSLFYAIVISLVIAIVSSSLILFAYLTRIEFDNSEINQRLNLNTGAGLNLLLSKQVLVGLNASRTIDLYNEGTDSVALTKKSWGAYEIIISKAIFKNRSVSRIAQTGYYPDTTNAYSLYLADEDKPLAVCGKTFIKGTAYLPKAGVKRAYIEGQNFTGNRLIEGNVNTSKTQLPEFNKTLLENIQLLFTEKSMADNDSIVLIGNELSEDTLANGFDKPSVILNSSAFLKIISGCYSGNIVVIATQKITISAAVNLKDIIVCAPKVFIEEGFRGNLQIFASDSILVGKNVTLSYPSVLGIVVNDRSPTINAIFLEENDSISGNIFTFKKESAVLRQTGITINKKAFVYGQVYADGYADVQGTIYGSLMCNKIMLRTPSSVYENHLLNATIDESKLSKHFVGINLVEESTVKRIVKWLE